MKRGIVLPQVEITDPSSDALIRFCRAAETAGYDHLLAYDHVLGADTSTRPEWSGSYHSEHPFLEPLVLFAHLGACTSLDFLTDVLVLPMRQTALVAKQVASLEAMLPGRLRLGVGIGWNEVEYDAMGADFHARGRRLTEQIGLLRRLLSEAVITHRGPWESIDRAGIAPRPAQPVQIWVGSGPSEVALRRVGMTADGWLPRPTLRPGSGLEDAWASVQRAATQAGRDPSRIGVEGQLSYRGDDRPALAAEIEQWRRLGASAVAINIMKAGASWPHGHIKLVESAAAAFAA